jgi:hypothetical protein
VGEQTSNTALRGGPASKWPGDMEYSFWGYSDSRKKIRVGMGGYAEQGFEDFSDFREGWLDIILRPTNALRVSFNPSFSRNRPEMQYVATESFQDEDRYLFGRLDQKTTSMTFRVDYCITPNLTVQYYGSPFISAGRYTEFKRITDPKASQYRERFHIFDGGQIAYNADDAVYYIDEDRDGVNDYSIDNPDFNFRDFNSNLVVRWEYMPGSLLYLVWSQARSEFLPLGNFDFEKDMRGLFDMHPHDVFLIKFIKWFSL